MNYSMLNNGVAPDGNMDFFGIIKWLLWILIIFVIVQNYWELQIGKIYVFTYHRYKTRGIWILQHTAVMLGICIIYSLVLMGVNALISDVEATTLWQGALLFAVFIFNMNYIFCTVRTMKSNVKISLWVVLFGVGTVLCSVVTSRQYWNISSYGMLAQQQWESEYLVSLMANLIVTGALIVGKVLLSRRRINK